MEVGKYVSLMQTTEVEIVSPYHPPMEVDVPLPEGAVGVMYVWKTKAAARKFYGRKVVLRKIDLVELKENPND